MTENKIDKILDILTETRIEVAKNTVSLNEHIRRTNILECEIKDLRKFQYTILGAFCFIQCLMPVLIKLFIK